MSVATGSEPDRITKKEQLVDYLAAGCKPRDRWAIGTEHEKFGYRLADLKALPYDGPDGILAMFEGLRRFGWEPVHEGGKIIGLTSGGESISLEPGGQFELSGAPRLTLHETCREVMTHLEQVKEIAGELGVAFHGLGFTPKDELGEINWMPKSRYAIMRRYMPTRGGHGLDMMTRTSTIQVNLDFESETDMVKKFRVALALSPVACALFANSPFLEGKPSGYLSYRSFVWTDTDPDRCGMLPFVFEDGMGFERYVDYALDAPMYFVIREGRYIDAAGQSFRAFLEGKLPALPGEPPLLSDWESHLTTLFPEARLKRYLEMRSADGGLWNKLCALPAFWVGLLYDTSSLEGAWELVSDWTEEEREGLRHEVPRTALDATFRGRRVGEIALEVLKLARAGLERRAQLDARGRMESHFLDPLDRIASSGKPLAQELLEAYQGRWNKSVDPVFEEYAY